MSEVITVDKIVQMARSRVVVICFTPLERRPFGRRPRGMKHALASLAVLASLGALPLLACSSSSGGGASGGGSGGCGTFGDLCKIVPLATLESTCGTHAATATADEKSDHGDVSSCVYDDGAGAQLGQVLRVCYPTATEAVATFQGEHDDPPIPGVTQTDVTGVGERAFYREDFSLGIFDLYVLQGQNLLLVHDVDKAATTGKKDCLVALVNIVLAVK
jgi:hypothetical protein